MRIFSFKLPTGEPVLKVLLVFDCLPCFNLLLFVLAPGVDVNVFNSRDVH